MALSINEMTTINPDPLYATEVYSGYELRGYARELEKHKVKKVHVFLSKKELEAGDVRLDIATEAFVRQVHVHTELNPSGRFKMDMNRSSKSWKIREVKTDDRREV